MNSSPAHHTATHWIGYARLSANWIETASGLHSTSRLALDILLASAWLTVLAMLCAYLSCVSSTQRAIGALMKSLRLSSYSKIFLLILLVWWLVRTWYTTFNT